MSTTRSGVLLIVALATAGAACSASERELRTGDGGGADATSGNGGTSVGATSGAGGTPAAGGGCGGTAGAAGQTTHDNAFGQFFYDCNPLCNQDSNCTQVLATAACEAYRDAGHGGTCGPYTCGSGTIKQYIIFASGADTCASWTYVGGAYVGQAYQNDPGACTMACAGYDNGIRWH